MTNLNGSRATGFFHDADIINFDSFDVDAGPVLVFEPQLFHARLVPEIVLSYCNLSKSAECAKYIHKSSI